jgi:nucleotide-binding universal stress UspA family protein
MKKILVPIDFSSAAKAGFDYAFQLSTITQSEIFALNVYQEVANNYSPDVSFLLQQEVEKKRKSTLSKFTGDYPNLRFSDEGASPTIHTSVRCGDIVDEIIAASIDYDVDTIIIGTKAKHNLWEYIFGSVSTNLIKQSKKPVLIVSEGLRFEKPKKIAFANDFFSEGLSLKYLDEFADIFGASIQQVHVNILPSDFSDLKEEIVESSENTTQKYTTIIRDKSVKKGLDFFIKTHHIDLLALYLPQRTFTEKLLHKSVSKQLALESKIPLLIFKE